jgi:hypothetical protein
MSRDIDMTDPEAWTDDDRRYLQERGLLPADVENVLPSGVQPGTPQDLPNYGDVHTWPPPDNEHEVMLGGKYLEYKERTPAELKDELRSRGLPASGTKGELVYRLLEDDERPVEEDEEFEEGATE